MNILDALNIIGVDPGNSVSFDDAKDAYRKASSKFHPDRNPAGLEMMKAITEAWRTIQAYSEFPIHLKDSENNNYGDLMNSALEAVINFKDIEIEICGTWIWLSGDTKPIKEYLKEAGYRWAPKKKLWYFRPPEFRSFSKGKYSMNAIRMRYGSKSVKNNESVHIAHS